MIISILSEETELSTEFQSQAEEEVAKTLTGYNKSIWFLCLEDQMLFLYPFHIFTFPGAWTPPAGAAIGHSRSANKSQCLNWRILSEFWAVEKGITEQATAKKNAPTVDQTESNKSGSNLKFIEMLLDAGVINTQEFIGSRHHVDIVVFAFRPLFVNVLEYGLISRWSS